MIRDKITASVIVGGSCSAHGASTPPQSGIVTFTGQAETAPNCPGWPARG